ncbi:MAG: hypothetical protein P8Y99_07150 [Calditrichaceae bacterium]
MRLIFLIMILILLMGIVHAGVFDDRYPSARATAMSNAYVAVANDVWAGYSNPAGLAGLRQYEFGFAIQRPYNMKFFRNGFLGVSIPLPQKYGTVGLLAETFYVDYNGNQLSVENTIGLSHGFYLLNDIHSSLSIGYNLKYYYWDLGESVGGLELGSAGTFGVDLGLQASIYRRTQVGVYVYNINGPTIGSEVAHDLPKRIVIGAAYKPYTGLTTSLAIEKNIGFDTQVMGGFEFFLVDWLAIRAGASTNPSRFSAGFGLQYSGFRLDYSFQTHDVLSETHKFGFIYRLGG